MSKAVGYVVVNSWVRHWGMVGLWWMTGEGKGDGNGYIGIYKTIMSRIKLSSLYKTGKRGKGRK